MTLEQAFEQFVSSEEYKEIAKQNTADGGKYRVYLSRYNRGELKAGAIVEILIANGYTVSADKTVKKKK